MPRRILGKGSFGIVFEDNGFAIKRHTGISVSWTREAIREVSAMSSIPQHPNLMPLIRAYIDEKQRAHLVFPVMEETLAVRMRRPYSVADCHRWSGQILDGISHMHSHHYVHRDIKLENIMIHNNNAVICDFGMARRVPFKSDGQQLSGNVCSLWTRCPELSMGRTVYDDRVDSWSVGCVLLALAAGKYVIKTPENKSILAVILSLLGLPDDWPNMPEVNFDTKKFRHKTDLERRDTIRHFFVHEVSNEYTDLVLKLLVIPFEKRPRILDVHATSTTELVRQPFIQTRRDLGIWMWNTLKMLGMTPLTFLYAFTCFLRCTTEDDLLCAAASCSLAVKCNEMKVVLPSVWAKTCSSKVKNILQYEDRVVSQVHGVILYPILVSSDILMFCALLCLKLLSYEDAIITIQSADFKDSGDYKECMKMPMFTT